jgi:molybdenum ABC transporter molybdate-binding protein
MPKTDWANDWAVGVRVWIERHGAAVLGEGRADLLRAVGEHRSITKAAKTVGLSYRKAWGVIQEVNEAAGQPLVEAAVGGKKGGGAELTGPGRLALEVYDRVRRTFYDSAGSALQKAVAQDADSDGHCVHLAAAISLQDVLGELLAEYALRRPVVRVRAVFGASNELADHVLAGAACDIFISAERTEIDRLEAAKFLIPSSRRAIVKNGLAAISRAENKRVRKAGDLLTSAAKHVALAEPACPLGRYSKAYLERAGVYERLLPKVVHVDNSRAVGAAVLSRAAEVGLVFASDAARLHECCVLFRVASSQAAPQYVAALVRRGKQTDEAKALASFLRSAAANRSFRRFGFQPVN